jgi:DNA polymerase-3 subunit beta
MKSNLKIVKSYPYFTVDAKTLREALELGAPEKKTTIPILSNVLFELVGDILKLTTTDLDQAVVTELDAIPSKHKGPREPFTIPWRKTIDLLSGETGLVVFTPLENNWVKMTVGGVEYKLIGMAVTNYPKLMEAVAPFHNISGETLCEMLSRTTFAISQEESRYTLNGARFLFNSGSFQIAATDGHRLAVEKRQMDVTCKDGTQTIIVPRDALAWLSKAKRLGKEFVGVSWSDLALTEARIFFHLPHLRTVFSTRKLNGTFPTIEAVTPSKEEVRITAAFLSAEAVSKLLTRVAKFADERSGAVRFNFNGKVTFSAQSTESGEALADVPAVLTGTEEDFSIKIGLNSGYVLDVLKVIGKKPVSILLKDAQSAAMIVSPEIEGYTYILMPMRL